MSTLLIVFLTFFPFLIYPGTAYYTYPKAGYLALFTLVLWLLFLRWLRKNPGKLQVGGVEITVAVLAALMLLSTVFSVDVVKSMYGAHKRLEGLGALYAYLSVFLFSAWFISLAKYRLLVKLFAVSGALCGIYGILQRFYLDFLPRDALKLEWYRSYAFFDNPNFFGSYLILMITVTVSIYLISQTRMRWLWLASACLMYVPLLYSLTRSAWVGLFVGLVTMACFVLISRRELLGRILVLALVFCIIFGGLNYLEGNMLTSRLDNTWEDWSRLRDGDGDAGSGRLHIWSNSLPLVRSYFWLGSGPDTFGNVFPAHTHFFFDKAHNEYLQMAVTMGVPMLVTYLVLVFMVLRKAFAGALAAGGTEQVLRYGLAIAVVAYLVQAFFNISVVPVAPFYWAMLGINYGLNIKQPGELDE